MSRMIRLSPYNGRWPDLYRQEARQIAKALTGEIILIHHIGSTALPGILAKPIIDCLVEVQKIETIDFYNDVLIALGYDPRGENGIPGRRYFVKRNAEIHTYHLHVFQTGHPEINRYLDFRDYLRVHPDKARAYSELKETLVRKFWNNSVAYTEGKNEFVREIDQLAAIYCKR